MSCNIPKQKLFRNDLLNRVDNNDATLATLRTRLVDNPEDYTQYGIDAATARNVVNSLFSGPSGGIVQPHQ